MGGRSGYSNFHSFDKIGIRKIDHMGGSMEKEQTLNYMWAFAYYLIKHKEFSLLPVPKMNEVGGDEESIHLFHKKGNELQYIRLSLANFVWSSVVERSIKESLATAEWLRQTLHTSSITALHFYFFPRTPLEDVQVRMGELERVRIGENTYLQSAGVNLETLTPLPNQFDYTPFPLSKDELEAFLKIEPVDSKLYKKNLYEEEMKEKEKSRKFFQFAHPLWTYLIIGINVLLFLLMTFQGGSQNPETLLRFGAKYNPAIEAGEWWRLFSSMFLHIGFIHLALNSVALYYLGILVERMYGRGRFLLIYLLSGLFGMIASFLYNDALSAGASGAIFGLFGALLYFGIRRKELFFQTFGRDLLVIIGINLVMSFLLPSIDINAHLGGLVGGFLTSFAVGLPQIDNKGVSRLFLLLLLLILMGAWLRLGFIG